MKITEYEFIVHGGEERIDGKGYWPDRIIVRMNRFFAWETVRSLLAQLKRIETEIEEEDYIVDHLGQLNELEPEEDG
jgi:hypothetical protein